VKNEIVVRKEPENKKKYLKKPNSEKKPIKILKKSIGLVSVL
jgi:hypothetical protein